MRFASKGEPWTRNNNTPIDNFSAMNWSCCAASALLAGAPRRACQFFDVPRSPPANSQRFDYNASDGQIPNKPIAVTRTRGCFCEGASDCLSKSQAPKALVVTENPIRAGLADGMG